MKDKIVLKVEILILFILFAVFILSVIYAYVSLKRSTNEINQTSALEPTSKLYPIKPSSEPQDQKPVLNCSQVDKAYFENSSKKYVVTLGSNSSDATWSIQNNLNCSPLAGSGSTFNTRCTQHGTSTATVSIGTLQNTCQFSTIPGSSDDDD